MMVARGLINFSLRLNVTTKANITFQAFLLSSFAFVENNCSLVRLSVNLSHLSLSEHLFSTPFLLVILSTFLSYLISFLNLRQTLFLSIFNCIFIYFVSLFSLFLPFPGLELTIPKMFYFLVR